MGSSIIGDLLTKIGDSAASYVGEEGAQWILSAVLGVSSDDDQILGDLDSLQKTLGTLTDAVTQLEGRLGNFEQDWEAETDFGKVAGTIDSSVTEIQNCYGMLKGLQKGSTDNANELAGITGPDGKVPPSHDFNGDLDTIHNAMIGNAGAYPGLELMTTVAEVQIAKLKNGEVASIGAAYSNFENYFARMLTIETEGLVLALNRYLASKAPDTTDANARMTTFRKDIRAQYEYFLAAAQYFAVHYYQTDALLDMMLAPMADSAGHVLDPIRAAQQYIVDNTLPGDPVIYRLYQWAGSGPGFSTGVTTTDTTASLSPGYRQTALTAKTTPVQYTAGSNTWSMSRFDFPNPPANEYWYGDSGFQNARLDPATDNTIVYGLTAVEFSSTSTLQSFTAIGTAHCPLSNSYLQTGFCPSAPFTVSAWIWAESVPMALLANGDSESVSGSFGGKSSTTTWTGWWELYMNGDGSVSLWVRTPGTLTTGGLDSGSGWVESCLGTTKVKYDTGAWHHYAVSQDGTKIYALIDGQQVLSGTFPIIDGTGITVGVRVDLSSNDMSFSSSPTTTLVDGGPSFVSELCIWNVAKTGTFPEGDPSQEVVTRYRKGPQLTAVWGLERGNLTARSGNLSLSIVGASLEDFAQSRVEDDAGGTVSSDSVVADTPVAVPRNTATQSKPTAPPTKPVHAHV